MYSPAFFILLSFIKIIQILFYKLKFFLFKKDEKYLKTFLEYIKNKNSKTN